MSETAVTPRRAEPWWFARVWPEGGRRPKYGRHPLSVLAGMRCYSEGQALDWLQERGFISDQVMSFDEVAPVDVARVMRAARREELLPAGWVRAFGL